MFRPISKLFLHSGEELFASSRQIQMVMLRRLADVFDALSSKRPYKNAIPLEECIGIIEEGRGSHFDPNLVTPFIKIAREFMATPGLDSVDNLRPILGKYLEGYFQVMTGAS